MDKLRWGIIGTGNIARQFAAGVNASQRGVLAAVASRSTDSANAFAATHRVARAYGSYKALLADRDIDAVYVSLPNTLHREWTISALAVGKHVLCEKPFAANLAESEEMFAAAERHGRVVIEAFMYRAHPLTAAWRKSIADGAIGPVRLIRSSFCYRTTKIEGNIRFDPHLAGGALMDIGCYCIDLSRMVAGSEPVKVHASPRIHPTGVDEVTVATMEFPGGVLASFTCGMSVQADNAAYVCGTDGYIEIPVPWKPPPQGAAYTIARSTPPRMDSAAGKVVVPPPRQTVSVDAGCDLYGLEADSFAATVLDGTPRLMTRADTLANMKVLDEMRQQAGLI